MWFLSLIFLIPIIFIGLTVKYLKDVREYKNCDEINSPYLSFYYYYYWIDLIFLIILAILTFSIFASISSDFNRFTKTFKKNVKKVKKYDRKVGHNYIHTFLNVLLLGFFIKLLYDISNEEDCKDVNPGLRTFLLGINSFSLFSLIMNLFTM